MLIRRYHSTDLDAVIAIFRSNIPKYFGESEEPGLRNFLATRVEEYFLGELGADIIAAGGIALNDDETVSLCWGMVHGDFLGRGLGRELTEFRIRKSRERFGPRSLVISTSQHTKGFYQRFGFRLTAHTRDGLGPGLDKCQMRLDF